MKKIAVLLTIIIAFLGIFIFSCEEEEIEEPSAITNKFQFTETKVDSVSYRYVILSYQAENPDKLTIKEMGVVWNKEGEPDKEDTSKVIQVKEKDSIRIENLLPGTQYYYRFYIEFEESTKYFEENLFETTEISKPVLETNNVIDITARSAKSGGKILDKKGGTIPACGICFNAEGSPTIQNTITTDSLENLSFNSNIDSLHYNTTYYVRAYATNEAGTGYGNEISFTTRDGLAELTTNPVSNVTSIEAKSGGNISENWGYEITSRGVCWSKTSNPTLEDNKTEDGSGTGSFESEITGLEKNSIYYVRAYATNEPGTAYGNERQFTTNELNVSVTTGTISNVTAISAEGGGNIVNSSNYSITQRGLCWNTTGNPTTSDNTSQNGTGEGDFTSSITGLNYETTYYVRAYAINDAGMTYGEEKQFTTLDGIPSLITSSVTNITPSSAESGGEITNNEGLNINSRGVCWNNNGNPVASDNNTSDGSGTGTYTSSLTNLNLNTTYYVRAYAKTDAGTGYGAEKNFTVGGKPTVTTATITNINGSSAEGGGDVTDNGGFSVNEKGVCWSTSSNPTTSDNTTNDGSGTGSFTSSISGLSPSTTYYVRTYATNDAGTSYGEERSFTTEDGLPELTTNEITDITGSSATSGGNITDNGGFDITACGVCWSTSSNPTTSDNTTNDGSGTGSFTSELTGLTEVTTYYVRAYATNSLGTSYGDQVSFMNLVEVTNPVTGKTWMDRNLGANSAATNSTDEEAYGDLYQWGRDADGHEKRNSGTTSTLSNSDTPGHGDFITVDSEPYDWRSPQNDNLWQGVNGTNNPCPGGYRLPTEAEWEAERQSWSSNDAAGAYASPLKLPVAGARGNNGSLGNVGSGGRYWSSTVDDNYSRYLSFYSSNAFMFLSRRVIGFSVRCLKD